VTGASRGIGLAVVRALTETGAQVVASARQPSWELMELAQMGRVIPVMKTKAAHASRQRRGRPGEAARQAGNEP